MIADEKRFCYCQRAWPGELRGLPPAQSVARAPAEAITGLSTLFGASAFA